MDLPDFAFCLTKPWSLDKANAVGVSPEMLSYISNVLVTVSAPQLELEEWARLEQAYGQTLARFNNNLSDLLDSVTFTCVEVVLFCVVGSEKIKGNYNSFFNRFMSKLNYSLAHKTLKLSY